MSDAAPASDRTVVGLNPVLPWPLSGWRWWTEPVRAERLAVLRIALALLLLADIFLTYLPQLHDYFGPGSLGAPEMFDYLARAPKWNWSLLRGFRDPLLYTAAQAVWLGATPIILLGLWGRLTAAGRPGPNPVLRWALAAWTVAGVWVVFGLWTRVLPAPGPDVAAVPAPLAALGWRLPMGMVGVASLFGCLAVWRRVKDAPDDDPWVWRWVLLAWLVSAALAALAVGKILAGADALPLLSRAEGRWHGEATALRVAMVAWVVAVVLLLLGLWTRASAAAAWVLAMSFDNLNWYINNAGDQVRCITLFYLMLSPCGAAWSVDSGLARLRGRRSGPVYVSPWPLRLLFVQMASMYFWNGLYKVIGPEWQEGSSLYYVWCDLTLARFSYAELPVPLALTRVMSWSVVAWELAFPLLALFRWTRPVALLFGFLFHLGILATLEIGGFAPYMMILYLPLLPWDRWLERRTRSPAAATPPQEDKPVVQRRGALVESHRLVQKGSPRGAEWVLAWDDAMLTLDAPDGQRVLEVPLAAAHRLVELYELYSEGKVSFATRHGSLAFKKQSAAVAAVRRLVEAGMASDPEFCADLRRRSLRAVLCGLVLFVVGGGLLGLCCWYASWAPNPPPDHWIWWFGWAIHGLLLVLMAVGLLGASVAYFGLRLRVRVRRIERLAAAAQRHAQPGAVADPGLM